MVGNRYPKPLTKRLYEHDNVEVRIRERLVSVNGRLSEIMSPSEFRVLQIIMAKPTGAATRQEIYQTLYTNRPKKDPRGVDVFIYRLRKRLKPTGLEIVSIRFGVQLVVPASPESEPTETANAV